MNVLAILFTLGFSCIFIKIYNISETPAKSVADIYFESLKTLFFPLFGKKKRNCNNPLISLFSDTTVSHIFYPYTFSSLANLLMLEIICAINMSVSSSLFCIILNHNLLWGFVNFGFNDIFFLKRFRYNEIYYVQCLIFCYQWKINHWNGIYSHWLLWRLYIDY